MSVITELPFEAHPTRRLKLLRSLRDRVLESGAVVMRSVPAAPRYQLQITASLGPIYGSLPGFLRSRMMPELRLEGGAFTNPYNEIWHSDTSWADEPAQFTLLYGLEIDDAGAATELADMTAGLEALAPDEMKDVERSYAFHHVEQARRIRFPEHADRAPVYPARAGRLAALAEAWRSGLSYSGTPLPKPPLPGARHPLVALDRASGQRHVYLSEHAWQVEDMTQAEGIDLLDRLTECCTQSVAAHRWQSGDLLIFNNRTQLHRRGEGGGRLLRRSMALAVSA